MCEPFRRSQPLAICRYLPFFPSGPACRKRAGSVGNGAHPLGIRRIAVGIVRQPLVLIADTDHGVGKPPRPGDPETGGRNAGFCGPKLPVVLQRLRRSGAGAPASPPRPPSPLRRQRQEEEDPGDPSADPQSFFDAIIKQSFFSKGRSPRSTPLGMKREPKQLICSTHGYLLSCRESLYHVRDKFGGGRLAALDDLDVHVP